MKIIFDGTVGAMSASIPGVSYLLIKKGIGTGKADEIIKHDYYKKGNRVDLDEVDVVFEFNNSVSIDVIIKALKTAKKELRG